MAVRVQAADFDPGAELAALSAGRTDIGAVTSFTGLVRGDPTAEGAPVAVMELEHYPGMTEKQLEKIEAEAAARWPVIASTIIHRYGPLAPGDRIVFVAVASAHRAAAFEAAEFIMDYLKTKAPFWKRELNAAGDGRWVDARESDDQAAERWAR
ncbi:MAG: molybdopterin synthase catalytic subunit MoaE [Neomegalonema sp.]|nr:molybdopterin synthase catalytic subunit MoaE [Neomegalonema sp.]